MPSITKVKIHPATTGQDYRADLLLDATVQFCLSHPQQRNSDSDQFKKLFYSLIGYTSNSVKKLISLRLARHQNTPRAIAFYLAMERIDIATPLLLISPVFWETDLIRLVKKLDLPYLSIIARRADITPSVAQALITHGNDDTRRVLSANPAVKLNAIGNRVANSDGNINSAIIHPPEENEAPSDNVKTTDREELKQELLKLANVGGKGIGNIQENKAATRQSSTPEKSLGARLLSNAKAKDYHLVISELSQQVGMDSEKIKKIVLHENPSSLAIFLKGLGISAPEASQLLVELNKSVAQNIAELTRCMEQFDRFSISQCRDIMRNLGARLPDPETGEYSREFSSTVLNNAVSARRRQISTNHAPVLFGKQRKTG